MKKTLRGSGRNNDGKKSVELSNLMVVNGFDGPEIVSWHTLTSGQFAKAVQLDELIASIDESAIIELMEHLLRTLHPRKRR